MALAIFLVVSTNILGAFITPLTLSLFVKAGNVAFPIGDLIVQLVGTIFAPLVVGKALQELPLREHIVKRLVTKFNKPLTYLSNTLLACIPWMKVGDSAQQGRTQPRSSEPWTSLARAYARARGKSRSLRTARQRRRARTSRDHLSDLPTPPSHRAPCARTSDHTSDLPTLPSHRAPRAAQVSDSAQAGTFGRVRAGDVFAIGAWFLCVHLLFLVSVPLLVSLSLFSLPIPLSLSLSGSSASISSSSCSPRERKLFPESGSAAAQELESSS